jgi:hypothetical protein
MPQYKLFFKTKKGQNGKDYYEAFNPKVGKVLLFEADGKTGVEFTANVVKKYSSRPRFPRPYYRRSSSFTSYRRPMRRNRRW